MNRALLIICLLLCSSLSLGEPMHEIDISMNKCLSKKENMSTAGMANCTNKAQVKWSAELDKNYQALMRKLDDSGRKNLAESQQAWVLYKELEYKNIENIYKQLSGSMYIPMRANEILRITRHRALELDGYLSKVSM